MKILDLVHPGDLVFDVGANRGEKSASYLARDARVVAIEPQPELAVALRGRFAMFYPPIVGHGHQRRLPCWVTVEECALGGKVGSAEMLLCDQNTTVSTLEPRFTMGRHRDTGHTWSRSIEVPVETLDGMIAKYGRPDFVKIDVEGFEPQVLAGLSQSVPTLSFEFHREFPEATRHCLLQLRALGFQAFNLASFEGERLLTVEWVEDDEAILWAADKLDGGDIYARSA